MHILTEQETEVTKVLFEAFETGWPISKDFQRLPLTYNMDVYTIHCYKRIRPTSREVALDTLLRMVRGIQERPGSQLDWVSLQPFLIDSITREPGGYFIETHANKPNNGPINCFACLGPFTGNIQHVMGTVRVPDA